MCIPRVPLLWEGTPTERLPSCLVRVAHHVCALRAWASSDHRAGAGGRKGCRSPAATSYASTRRRRLINRRHQGWAWWHEARIAPLRRPRAPNAQGQPSETGAITRVVTPHRRVLASQKSMAPGDDGCPAPDSFVLSMWVTACQMCGDAHPLAVSVKWRRRHQWSHYPLDKSPPHSIQHRTLVLLICGEGADGK